MKAFSWKKEWIFLLPFLAMWAVYFMLMDRLPDRIGSHFHITEGKWIADSQMAPVVLMIVMTLVYLVVYGTMTASAVASTRPISPNMQKGLWLFKACMLAFLSAITVFMLWLGAEGQIDPKISTTLITLPLLFTNAFIFFIFRSIRKSGERMPLSPKYYNILWAALHLFISWIMVSSIAASAGYRVGDGKTVYLMIFAFLAIMGNMMYNIKPNYFVGIRTPWTLKNEEVWKRTHRFGSIAMFLAGLGAFIVTLASPQARFDYLLQLVVLVGAIIPAIYSYIVYRRLSQTK